MPLIDYAQARERVSLYDVLTLLGYPPLRKFAGQTYGFCPLGCKGRPRCCSFNLDKHLWHCHQCGKGGNQLDLYAERRGMTLFQGTVCLFRQMGIPVPWFYQPGEEPRSNDPTGERRPP